jgi:nicotinamide-nucleotide amidase
MDDSVQQIAETCLERGIRVAVAESLTSGALASRLGAGPDAATWFRGGVVAYDEGVKFDVLGVTPGPLVTKRCAREMAEGAARLLGADAAIGVTGVGGPEPSEGEPPGTVVVAVRYQGAEHARVRLFGGNPEDVISATVDHAVAFFLTVLLSNHPRG